MKWENMKNIPTTTKENVETEKETTGEEDGVTITSAIALVWGGVLSQMNTMFCLTKNGFSLNIVAEDSFTQWAVVALVSLILGSFIRLYGWEVMRFSPIACEVLALLFSLKRSPWEFYLNKVISSSQGGSSHSSSTENSVFFYGIDYRGAAMISYNSVTTSNHPSEEKSKRSNSILSFSGVSLFRVPSRINMHFCSYYSPIVFFLEMAVYFLLALAFCPTPLVLRLFMGFYFCLLLVWAHSSTLLLSAVAVTGSLLSVLSPNLLAIFDSQLVLEGYTSLLYRVFACYGLALVVTLVFTDTYTLGNVRAAAVEFVIRRVPTYLFCSQREEQRPSAIRQYMRSFVVNGVLKRCSFITLNFISMIGIWFIGMMFTHGLNTPFQPFLIGVHVVLQYAEHFWKAVHEGEEAFRNCSGVLALHLVLYLVLVYVLGSGSGVLLFTLCFVNALFVTNTMLENKKYTREDSSTVFFFVWVLMSLCDTLWHLNGVPVAVTIGGFDHRGLVYALHQFGCSYCLLSFCVTSFATLKELASTWKQAKTTPEVSPPLPKRLSTGRKTLRVARAMRNVASSDGVFGSDDTGDGDTTTDASSGQIVFTESMKDHLKQLEKKEREEKEREKEREKEKAKGKGKEEKEKVNVSLPTPPPKPRLIRTSHSRVFEGDDWEVVLRDSTEELKVTFAKETESACELPAGSVRSIEFKLGSLHVTFEVEHREDIKGADIDAVIQSHSYHSIQEMYELRAVEEPLPSPPIEEEEEEKKEEEEKVNGEAKKEEKVVEKAAEESTKPPESVEPSQSVEEKVPKASPVASSTPVLPTPPHNQSKGKKETPGSLVKAPAAPVKENSEGRNKTPAPPAKEVPKVPAPANASSKTTATPTVVPSEATPKAEKKESPAVALKEPTTVKSTKGVVTPVEKEAFKTETKETPAAPPTKAASRPGKVTLVPAVREPRVVPTKENPPAGSKQTPKVVVKEITSSSAPFKQPPPVKETPKTAVKETGKGNVKETPVAAPKRNSSAATAKETNHKTPSVDPVKKESTPQEVNVTKLLSSNLQGTSTVKKDSAPPQGKGNAVEIPVKSLFTVPKFPTPEDTGKAAESKEKPPVILIPKPRSAQEIKTPTSTKKAASVHKGSDVDSDEDIGELVGNLDLEKILSMLDQDVEVREENVLVFDQNSDEVRNLTSPSKTGSLYATVEGVEETIFSTAIGRVGSTGRVSTAPDPLLPPSPREPPTSSPKEGSTTPPQDPNYAEDPRLVMYREQQYQLHYQNELRRRQEYEQHYLATLSSEYYAQRAAAVAAPPQAVPIPYPTQQRVAIPPNSQVVMYQQRPMLMVNLPDGRCALYPILESAGSVPPTPYGYMPGAPAYGPPR